MHATAPQPSAPERYCLGCHYPLMGLPANRCPECGHPFDPGDPATFHTNLTQAGVEKWLRVAVTGRHAFLWGLFLLIIVGTALEPRQARILSQGEAMMLVILIPTLGALVLFGVGVAAAGYHYQGVRYAIGHVIAAIFLVAVSGLGLWVVPSLIRQDLRREMRQAAGGQRPPD